MFVKLVFPGRESLYQCDRFIIEHLPAGESEVHLESNHPGGSVSIGRLDRSAVDIFVMNDAGKTIERYHPTPPRPPTTT